MRFESAQSVNKAIIRKNSKNELTISSFISKVSDQILDEHHVATNHFTLMKSLFSATKKAFDDGRAGKGNRQRKRYKTKNTPEWRGHQV